MSDLGSVGYHAMEQEWLLMQTQFDSYEKFSLIVKLTSIVLFSFSTIVFNDQPLAWGILFLLMVLWLQDSIWKAYQARIEARLLALEDGLSGSAELIAYQFNREFQKNRPGSVGLILEYLAQAARPTMIFPHALLVLVQGWLCLG